MKNDSEAYDKFLDHFRMMLKEWVYYEGDLKEEIAWLVKFKSMSESKNITFDEYIEKQPETEKSECCWGEKCTDKKQEEKEKEWCCGWGHCDDKKEEKTSKTIYYITWKSEWEVLASPYLAQFRDNNVDVLFFTDPIDEWLLQAMTEYKWNPFKNISSWDINLKEETKEEKEEKEKLWKEYKDLLELAKNTISADKIEKVELNENLWDAIAALKTPENGMNPQMEKMMKSMWQAVPAQKRILELNPNSGIVKAMKNEFTSDVKSQKLSDMINYSYSWAILLEGWELENIWEFVRLTNKFAWEYIK